MLASKIKTDRLILRTPLEEDLEAIFEIHGNPQTNRFNPAGPHQLVTDSRTMLKRWLKHWEKYEFGYWVIATQKDPQTIIGCGGLMYKDIAGRQRANLYYRFRPSAWGKGFASEMATAACKYAFEELHLDQVAALVRPSNEPSIRLLKRLKMVRRGIIKDKKGDSYFYILENEDAT